MYLKKGDNIIIITGKEKGKTGKISRIIRERNMVVVSGLNTVKRRTRPKKEGQKGQVVSVSMPLHASNVMLVTSRGVRTRIGIRRTKEERVRISKKDGAVV